MNASSRSRSTRLRPKCIASGGRNVANASNDETTTTSDTPRPRASRGVPTATNPAARKTAEPVAAPESRPSVEAAAPRAFTLASCESAAITTTQPIDTVTASSPTATKKASARRECAAIASPIDPAASAIATTGPLPSLSNSHPAGWDVPVFTPP